MVVPAGFKHTWSPGQLCMFGLVSVVLMGLTSLQTVGGAKNQCPCRDPLQKIRKAAGTDVTFHHLEFCSGNRSTLKINDTEALVWYGERVEFTPEYVKNKPRVNISCDNKTFTIKGLKKADGGCYAFCTNAGHCVCLGLLEVKPDEQSCRDQTGTDPPSSPITVNNTTNVTESNIIKDGKKDLIIGGSVAGVLVLIIDCYRKNCAKQAQRPDQENAIERVPLDSPTPRDHTPEDCPTGKLIKDCDGVSVEGP